MPTTLFALRDVIEQSQLGSEYTTKFRVPTLDAYAVSSVVVHLGALAAPWDVDCICEDVVSIQTPYKLDDLECNLTVNYIGFRDYALLFPSVSDASLKARLGQFYSELELSFDAGAWLTFMLMTGAVVEGILYSRIGRDATFELLIDEAHQTGLLSIADKNLLHTVRKYRNLVHASRHADSYVARLHAMDARVLVERLIRKG